MDSDDTDRYSSDDGASVYRVPNVFKEQAAQASSQARGGRPSSPSRPPDVPQAGRSTSPSTSGGKLEGGEEEVAQGAGTLDGRDSAVITLSDDDVPPKRVSHRARKLPTRHTYPADHIKRSEDTDDDVHDRPLKKTNGGKKKRAVVTSSPRRKIAQFALELDIEALVARTPKAKLLNALQGQLRGWKELPWPEEFTPVVKRMRLHTKSRSKDESYDKACVSLRNDLRTILAHRKVAAGCKAAYEAPIPAVKTQALAKAKARPERRHGQIVEHAPAREEEEEEEEEEEAAPSPSSHQHTHAAAGTKVSEIEKIIEIKNQGFLDTPDARRLCKEVAAGAAGTKVSEIEKIIEIKNQGFLDTPDARRLCKEVAAAPARF